MKLEQILHFFVFSFFASVFISGSTTTQWSGESGDWNLADNWDIGTVPVVGSIVKLSLSANQIIRINQNVTVSELELSGGTVQIANNVTLSVTNKLLFNYGNVRGSDLLNRSSACAAVISEIESVFAGSGTKRFRNIRFEQQGGIATWTGGEITMYNTTFSIGSSAQFVVQTNQSSSAPSMRMKADNARSGFDYYAAHELNANINLIHTQPVGAAVYDIILPSRHSLVVATSSGSGLTFPLAVSSDLAATEYYAYHVPELAFGYRFSLHNRTVSFIDEDNCAHLCRDVYPWCASFDYHFRNQTCRLSRFRMAQVGGLTAKSDVAGNFSYPVAHYEARPLQRETDSFLNVYGRVVITGDGSSLPSGGGGAAVFLDVAVALFGSLQVDDAANVTFSRKTSFESSSTANLSDHSVLLFGGANASLSLRAGAAVWGSHGHVSHLNALNRSSGLVFDGPGSHAIFGTLNGSLSLVVGNSATLRLWPVNQSEASAATWLESSTHTDLHELRLYDGGAVYIEGSAHNTLHVIRARLQDHAALHARHLDVLAAEFVTVGEGSRISASGQGYAKSDGPAPGTAHAAGASGGSHGGRGGPSKVDATGLPYGSLTAPWQPGSGGGTGYYPTSAGGSGGGVISVTAPRISVDGTIECDGHNGVAAGGGGAGGSLLLVAQVLSGVGTLSATGGDGDFSGGTAAGGGGSGGRVSVVAGTYSFDGTLDVSGGALQATYDRKNQEQAGPGTVFVNASTTGILAVLASNRPVASYLASLVGATPLTSEGGNQSQTSGSAGFYRGAHILESSEDFSFADSCALDLHVVGSAPLVLAGRSFCLGTMVGSDNGTVYATNGVALEFSAATLSVGTVALHLINSSLPHNANVTVARGGSVHLYDLGGDGGGDSYQFHSLALHNGSSLFAHNASLRVLGGEFAAQEGSAVRLFGELSVHSGAIALDGTSIAQLVDGDTGSTASVYPDTPTLLLSNTSTTVITNDVHLSHASLVFLGPTTFQGAAVSISRESADSVSQVVFSATSSVTFSGASAELGTETVAHTGLTVSAPATLTLSGGGTFHPGTSLAVAGTVLLQGGDFWMMDGSEFTGSGHLAVSSGGVLYPPSLMLHSGPVLHIAGGGRVDLHPNDLLGGSGAAGTYNVSAVVSVEPGGLLRVGNSTTALFLDLQLVGGTVRTLEQDAVVALVGSGNLWSGGLVVGNGSVHIEAGAVLTIQAAELDTTAEFLTVLGVAVRNYGEIRAPLNGTVNFAQQARVFNHGLLSSLGAQQWVHDEQLYAFEEPTECAVAMDAAGGVAHYNLSSAECAYKCVHAHVPVVTYGGLHRPLVKGHECRAFLYNTFLRACQVQVSALEAYGKCDESAAARRPTSWLLFRKVGQWAAEPRLYNAAEGAVEAVAGSSTGIGISVENSGSIVGQWGSGLTFTGHFNQTASGELESRGLVTISDSNFNSLSGIIGGNGTVVLGAGSGSGAEVVLSSLHLQDPALSLLVRGRIKVAHNVSRILVRDLRIDGGLLRVQERSLTVDVVTELRISGGIFDSVDGVAADDPNCSSCFDANITANSIVLSENGRMAFAFAYITAGSITVEATTSMSCSGRGHSVQSPGSRAAFTGTEGVLGSSGGSHGGVGGAAYDQVVPLDFFQSTRSYGHFHDARSWGAAGGRWGAASSGTTSGGGALMVSAVSVLTVNGTIECDGMSPVDSLGGGGAGGSLHLAANSLGGSGVISAAGGNGGQHSSSALGRGGGGGGGRVTLLVNDRTDYSGDIIATGGDGHQRGSAGTIFVLDRATMTGGSLLFSNGVGGGGVASEPHSVLSEESPFGPLDALSIKEGSLVSTKVNAGSVAVRAIVGDGTGTLLLSNGTVLSTYGVYNASQNASAAARVLVLSDAKLVVADGVLDAQLWHILSGGELRLTELGATSAGALGTATYDVENVHVASGGRVVFDYRTVARVGADPVSPILLNVSSSLTVDGAGGVHSNAQGHRGSYALPAYSSCRNSSDAPLFGLGCGAYGSLGGGGGAHGGVGGDGVSDVGGRTYGDFDRPVTFGSGGGGAFIGVGGGDGGGAVHIRATAVYLNGVISANGAAGTGAGAGGGAGGSVHIRTEHLTGAGSIQAEGGDGLFSSVYFGGSGAGGRIAIDCSSCVLDRHPSGPVWSFGGNVSAAAGHYSFSSYPHVKEQSPIWLDSGHTSVRWLATAPLKGAAGTVYWESNSSAVALTVANSAEDSVTVSHLSAAGLVTASYALGQACTELRTSLPAVEYLTVRSQATAKILPGVAVGAKFVLSDSTGSLEVAAGASLWLAEEMRLSGGSITLAGKLAGAQTLTMSNSSRLAIHPNASWIASDLLASASDSSEVYPGVFNASDITLQTGSGVVFVGGDVYSDSRVVLNCDNLVLQDADTFVSADSQGYAFASPGRSTAEFNGSVHPDFKASGNVTVGDGGWHAGRGGGFYHNYTGYGNAFSPDSFGAAGGSTFQASGGSGGGAVRIIAASSVVVNGAISANGASCTSASLVDSSAGGGAGGSVWLTVLNGPLSGIGQLAAEGGDGCPLGGGAGSGGRIAVYSSAGDLSEFDGSVSVQSGAQNSLATHESHSPSVPAGGTIFVADSDGQNGDVVATNGGRGGSAVRLYDSCRPIHQSGQMRVRSLYVNDVDAVADASCVLISQRGMSAMISSSTFRTATIAANVSQPVLSLRRETRLAVERSVVLDGVRLEIGDHSTLLVASNVTLRNASSISLAVLGARLVSAPLDEVLTASVLNTLDSLLDSLNVSDSYLSGGLSYVSLESLTVGEMSTLEFLPQSHLVVTDSNCIVTHSIALQQSGRISARHVLRNAEITFDGNDTVASRNTFYGQHSGSSTAASGGGHAGFGTPGANNAQGGSPRGGDIFTPFGPGGPGGADADKGVSGGAGGGGLYLAVRDSLAVDGEIDVSGESGAEDTAAGGGAGGSVFVYAPTGVVSGSGRIIAQGGNGTISSNAAFHGGAGSGGLISIDSCVDNFAGRGVALGGLSLQFPAALPAQVSMDLFHRLSSAANASSGGYRLLQEVVAAPSGTVVRSASFHDTEQPDVTPSQAAACQAKLDSSAPGAGQYLNASSVSVESWDAASLRANTSELTARMASSLLLLSNDSWLPPVRNTHLEVDFPQPVSGLSKVYIGRLALANTELRLTGNGTVDCNNIDGDSRSTLILDDHMTLLPTGSLTVDGFTLELAGDSAVKNGVDLLVTNGGRLLVSQADPSSADSDPEASLTFGMVAVSSGAGIYGSRIVINARELAVSGNSTISADGRGYLGGVFGTPPIAPPSSGSGPGGGDIGLTGGCGGGHGGVGGLGINSLYRSIHADQYLGLTGDVSDLADWMLDGPLANGTSYGDVLAPVTYGSGGGGTIDAYGYGGRGGGIVLLFVQDDVHVDADSSISADGESVYGGGGGGAGGSIWIRRAYGHIEGGGRISATGGSTCREEACTVNIENPGGVGSGGRIRIDKTMEQFSGVVNTLSGHRNHSDDVLLTGRSGTFARVQAISTIVRTVLDNGEEAIDVTFTQTPLRMVQVISTGGAGAGDRNASSHFNAIVRGHWTLGYRSKKALDHALSSQATAAEVQAALLSLSLPDIADVTVTRRPSAHNGWSWSVTFFNSVERVAPIEVDGFALYCTTGLPSITVTVLNPLNTTAELSDVEETDAPANYTLSGLRRMLTFSQEVLGEASVGHWLNIRTLRVIPRISADNTYFHALLEVLQLVRVDPVPTALGLVSGIEWPYLLESFVPNWKFPTSLPSGQPTMSPTMQPSSQPTSQPSLQPFMKPSGVPSCQPTSNPTQPTGQPSSQPTNPTGQPTSQPTSPTGQPSSEPSGQPSGVPSTQPSSQPTNPTGRPTCQPSTEPSSQPSGQPASFPTSLPSSQPSMHPSGQPSVAPSGQPSLQPLSHPSSIPSSQPSGLPSQQPSAVPTMQPSAEPSALPSVQPSSSPSAEPSACPSTQPSTSPSTQPSAEPSAQPSSSPTLQPSATPTSQPQSDPTSQPSSLPTSQPTSPTGQPSTSPSTQPSSSPSSQPVSVPTALPSVQPSGEPSAQPSDRPSSSPSTQPSGRPSAQPAADPTGSPTSQPSGVPSVQPSAIPSAQPTSCPSTQPSDSPTSQPTVIPSAQPSARPSLQPSSAPTSVPTCPTVKPTAVPTETPTVEPTTAPSVSPSEQPSVSPTVAPTAVPTDAPTDAPSEAPTVAPTAVPSVTPSELPTVVPSLIPTEAPTASPTDAPTTTPTESPTESPSAAPSATPSDAPSETPSVSPTA